MHGNTNVTAIRQSGKPCWQQWYGILAVKVSKRVIWNLLRSNMLRDFAHQAIQTADTRPWFPLKEKSSTATIHGQSLRLTRRQDFTGNMVGRSPIQMLVNEIMKF